MPHARAANIRAALSREHGATFALVGDPWPAFPLPERLLELDAFEGLTDEKIRRLHAVADAALDGALDADRLAALDPARPRRRCARSAASARSTRR